MKKPHKHAELIKAWADGAEIEWKGIGMNTGWKLSSPLGWHDSIEYRLKPETSKQYDSIFELIENESKDFSEQLKKKLSTIIGKKVKVVGEQRGTYGILITTGILEEINWNALTQKLPYFKMDDGKTYVAHTFTVYD